MRILSLICLACSLAFAQTTKPVEKPKIITRDQWGSEPQEIEDSHKHTPKFITIHHAGTLWTIDKDPAKFVKALQVYGQKEKNWPDVPYHFMIAPDGKIFEGRDINYEPQSNTKYDLQGHIGVELMGNFMEQRASQQQLESLVKLAAWLCQDLKIDVSQISSHRDVAKGQTVCPGTDLYRYVKDGLVQKWVGETLEGKEPGVKLLPPLASGPTTMITETKK